MEELNGQSVEADEGKLQQLNLGDVPLPPQVRLDGGAKGGEGVVEVHDAMRKAVEHRKEAQHGHRRTDLKWEKEE